MKILRRKTDWQPLHEKFSPLLSFADILGCILAMLKVW